MKVQVLARTVISSALTALVVGAIAMPLRAATIDIETSKDNNVEISKADTANPAPMPPGVLNGFNIGMGYMAFDLTSLPAGATITAATFGTVDLRTTRAHTLDVYLVDTPADWDESTLTWNIAVANYGEVLTPSNTAAVDSAKVLWGGHMVMNASPDPAEVFATSNGGTGFTDQDLLDGLNAELTSGDGLAALVLVGRVGTNNYVADRDDPVNAGPTLHLTYSVVPEPSAIALSALAVLGAAVSGRRRENRVAERC